VHCVYVEPIGLVDGDWVGSVLVLFYIPKVSHFPGGDGSCFECEREPESDDRSILANICKWVLGCGRAFGKFQARSIGRFVCGCF
jgi:hypothetical protein